tara:strand:- start:9461 stop:9808 length:348 start_codon:yes stop_codon:yes gene_type:complete
MKLELKHLAPYLPYGLVVFIPIWKCERTISQLRQKSIVTKDFANHLLFADIKPILRPLSDLTEDILCISWIEHIEDKVLDAECPYEVWQILFENHFDVFGLIEKGLAIDINTTTK